MSRRYSLRSSRSRQLPAASSPASETPAQPLDSAGLHTAIRLSQDAGAPCNDLPVHPNATLPHSHVVNPNDADVPDARAQQLRPGMFFTQQASGCRGVPQSPRLIRNRSALQNHGKAAGLSSSARSNGRAQENHKIYQEAVQQSPQRHSRAGAGAERPTASPQHAAARPTVTSSRHRSDVDGELAEKREGDACKFEAPSRNGAAGASSPHGSAAAAKHDSNQAQQGEKGTAGPSTTEAENPPPKKRRLAAEVGTCVSVACG